jgi:1,4-alpha-glucan branching enzyme
MKTLTSPQINDKKETIEFFFQDNAAPHVSITGASQVCLAGSFNNWAHEGLNMTHQDDGCWKIEIPMLPKGKYQYKFYIDDKVWMEDTENPFREPDGRIGFNSILTV